MKQKKDMSIAGINRKIISSDVKKIRIALKTKNLTKEEKDYLNRLLKFKLHALKHVWATPETRKVAEKMEKEGEKWVKRKKKNFKLDMWIMVD